MLQHLSSLNFHEGEGYYLLSNPLANIQQRWPWFSDSLAASRPSDKAGDRSIWEEVATPVKTLHAPSQAIYVCKLFWHFTMGWKLCKQINREMFALCLERNYALLPMGAAGHGWARDNALKVFTGRISRMPMTYGLLPPFPCMHPAVTAIFLNPLETGTVTP